MRHSIHVILFLSFLSLSCKDYLDIKPRSELVVPSTLEDLQQLLDNGSIMYVQTDLLEILADDYYFEESYWNSISDQVIRNAHVWARDIYGTQESHTSWSSGYQKIFYANVVLDRLAKIERTITNAAQYDQVRGHALFIRAEALSTLAQLFAYPYNADIDFEFGLPIPVESDVNEKLSRTTVHETYNFIIENLKEALPLVQHNIDFSRPTKPSVLGLLARVYLIMGKYELANLNAEAFLDYDLSVYNLNSAAGMHYNRTAYLSFISPATYIGSNRANTKINRELYDSYDADDLRKSIYYRLNTINEPVKFSIHQLGIAFCFSGIDVEEILLTHAECLVRLDQTEAATSRLNSFLETRYRSGTFAGVNYTTQEDLLYKILDERRKELVFRGIRWADLRRLNEQGESIMLTRTLGDTEYKLQPRDHAMWTLPVPANEIISSKIKQLPR